MSVCYFHFIFPMICQYFIAFSVLDIHIIQYLQRFIMSGFLIILSLVCINSFFACLCLWIIYLKGLISSVPICRKLWLLKLGKTTNFEWKKINIPILSLVAVFQDHIQMDSMWLKCEADQNSIEFCFFPEHLYGVWFDVMTFLKFVTLIMKRFILPSSVSIQLSGTCPLISIVLYSK